MKHLSPDLSPIRAMIAPGFTVYEERKLFGESNIERTRARPVRITEVILARFR